MLEDGACADAELVYYAVSGEDCLSDEWLHLLLPGSSQLLNSKYGAVNLHG
ncbi:MAG: hypothetical protein ABR577_07155 [Pyrinomonadaceae bacterium]